jgi:hypothetical protein
MASAIAAARRARAAEKAVQQRAPYAGRGMPEPGTDPELASIVAEVLGSYLQQRPPPDVLQQVATRVHAHVTQENKRKNLLGEGFEDTLAAILKRIPGIADTYEFRLRSALADLPGFHPLAGQGPVVLS